jgi:predicted O-methyltransferase YrrM
VEERRWAAVDRYVNDALVAEDDALVAAREAAVSAGLPAAEVSPPQGKLLYLLARMCGARSILELGTLAAYSTIWLARALPAGGTLVTLESEPKHAEVARGNLARAGLDGVVDLRVGPALDALPRLAAERREPFDLVFLDADKRSNAEYLGWCLRLTAAGSVIVADNVVRGGHVIDASSGDPSVVGVRRFFDLVGAEPRLTATVIQTVGAKGYDGFALAVVL